ncbi:MAG TPA: hypothetical protein VGD67_25515 [Pseudonocardiaceae bacterium]
MSAAAIVGDTTIPIEYVQDWWDRVLENPELREQLREQSAFDDLGRVIVTEAVRHELLREVARREGISFDEAQVSELIEELGGEQGAIEAIRPTIYDSTTVRERARDQLLTVELGRKYYDRTSVTYDFVLVDSRDEAVAKAGELAKDPDKARDVIEAAAQEGASTGVGREQHMADNIDLVLSTPLFSVPAGHVVAFAEQGGGEGAPGQWIVAVITDRSTDAEPDDRDGATSADDLGDSRLEGVGLRLLALMGRDVEVRVSPRYGTWSQVFIQSIETEGEIPAVVVPFARPAAS